MRGACWLGGGTRPRRPGARGYTLTEMLLVVAIVGITASAVIPTLVPARQQRLEVAARELATALRFARDEALRTAGHYGLRVEPAGDRFRVFRLDTGGASPVEVYDVRHPLEKRLYDVWLDGRTPLGRPLITGIFKFGGAPEAAVAFNPRGEPVQPSDLLNGLSMGLVDLQVDGRKGTVMLDPLTGRVVVMD